jgi:hypothetical protein
MGIDALARYALVHCGSRGLGHQVAENFKVMLQASRSTVLPCRTASRRRPVERRGAGLLAAMRGAANYAWAKPPVHHPRCARPSAKYGEGEAARVELSTTSIISQDRGTLVAGKRKKLWCTAKGRRAPSRPGTRNTRAVRRRASLYDTGRYGPRSYVWWGRSRPWPRPGAPPPRGGRLESRAAGHDADDGRDVWPLWRHTASPCGRQLSASMRRPRAYKEVGDVCAWPTGRDFP